MGRLISDKYMEWERNCKERFNELAKNEQRLNSLFSEIYGIKNVTIIPNEQNISIRNADLGREIGRAHV